MFDMLTRDELSELHRTLCSQYHRQHVIIMGMMDLNQAGGGDILTLVRDPAWIVLNASHGELNEMCEEVYAELGRRNDADRVLDALRDRLANA